MTRFSYKIDAEQPQDTPGRNKSGRAKLAEGRVDAQDLPDALRQLANHLAGKSATVRAGLCRLIIERPVETPAPTKGQDA